MSLFSLCYKSVFFSRLAWNKVCTSLKNKAKKPQEVYTNPWHWRWFKGAILFVIDNLVMTKKNKKTFKFKLKKNNKIPNYTWAGKCGIKKKEIGRQMKKGKRKQKSH